MPHLSPHDEDAVRHMLCDGKRGFRRFVKTEAVLRAAQTISGIARLAGVDRRTVQRNQIKAGTFYAAKWIWLRRYYKAAREYTATGWHSKFTPLIAKPKERPPIILRGENVVDVIRDIYRSRDFQAEREVMRNPHAAPKNLSIIKEGKTKRRRKEVVLYVPADVPSISKDDSKYVFQYEIRGGRVSVKQLCGRLRISRAGFYKWLGNLSADSREMVRHQLKFPHSEPLCDLREQIEKESSSSRNRSD